MKKSLMLSAAAAALTLVTATPVLADCADEIAALKSQEFTGSIESDASAAPAPAGTSAAPSDTTAATTAPATAPSTNTLSSPMAGAVSGGGAESGGAAPVPEGQAQPDIASKSVQSMTPSGSGQGTSSDTAAAGETPAVGGADGTAGADVATAGQVSDTEATPAMNEAVGDRAASAADVRAQDAGQQTAAQQAESGQAPAANDQTAEAQGTPEQNTSDQFAVLLQKAEEYQKLGNEEACMNVIEQAKAAQ
jgi:trimeric autotransporter adhesin